MPFLFVEMQPSLKASASSTSAGSPLSERAQVTGPPLRVYEGASCDESLSSPQGCELPTGKEVPGTGTQPSTQVLCNHFLKGRGFPILLLTRSSLLDLGIHDTQKADLLCDGGSSATKRDPQKPYTRPHLPGVDNPLKGQGTDRAEDCPEGKLRRREGMASLTEAARVQGKGVDAGGRLPGFESSSQD